MSKLKRIIAAFVLVFFIAGPANALWPLMAGGYLFGAAASDAMVWYTGTLATAALGTAIAFLKFNDPAGQGNPIIVQLNPKAKLETPTGWTAPTTTIYPNAPSSTSITTTYSSGSWVSGSPTSISGAIASCQAIADNTYSGYSPRVMCTQDNSKCSTTSLNNYGYGYNVGNSTYPSIASGCNTPVVSCGSGYTLSGAAPNQTCTLSNNAIATKPALGRDMFVRTGNAFARDTQQNSNDTNQSNSLAYSAPGTGIMQFRVPSTGTRTTVTVNQTDGTTTVVTTSTNPDGQTSTRKTTTLTSPDANTGAGPTVSGQKTETLNCVGDGACAGEITTSTNNISGGGTVNIDTSNLATHSDVASVGDKVDAAKTQAHTDSQQLHDDLTTGGGDSPTFQSQKDADNSKWDEHIGRVDSIKDNPLDSHGLSFDWNPISYLPSDSSCDNSWFQFRDHVIDLCTTIGKIRQIFAWVIGILFLFALVRIFTDGNKET